MEAQVSTPPAPSPGPVSSAGQAPGSCRVPCGTLSAKPPGLQGQQCPSMHPPHPRASMMRPTAPHAAPARSFDDGKAESSSCFLQILLTWFENGQVCLLPLSVPFLPSLRTGRPAQDLWTSSLWNCCCALYSPNEPHALTVTYPQAGWEVTENTMSPHPQGCCQSLQATFSNRTESSNSHGSSAVVSHSKPPWSHFTGAWGLSTKVWGIQARDTRLAGTVPGFQPTWADHPAWSHQTPYLVQVSTAMSLPRTTPAIPLLLAAPG